MRRAGRGQRRAVQFGAGAIGRGFLGQLYSDSGWETVFVDVDVELTEALNARGGYTVAIVGPGRSRRDAEGSDLMPEARRIEVRNVRAVDGRDTDAVAREIVRADLVGTSVGQAALAAVAKALAEGIARRAGARPDSTLDVLLCENLLHASRRMRELLEPLVREGARAYLAERVGLVETVISRMIPVPSTETATKEALASRQTRPERRRRAGPGRPSGRPYSLTVAAEDYNVLPVDGTAFRGPVPEIEGLFAVDNFRAHEERKLYAHNCGHALAAYFGALKGYALVREAVEDPELRPRIEKGLWEAGEALCLRHGFTREEHAGHLAELLRRFANPALGDTIARVGRDPLRKLARGDRLVGAALLALEHGIEPATLAEGIAAAMSFRSDGDPSAEKLAEVMASGGAGKVLTDVCGLDPRTDTDRRLRVLVLEARRRIARVRWRRAQA